MMSPQTFIFIIEQIIHDTVTSEGRLLIALDLARRPLGRIDETAAADRTQVRSRKDLLIHVVDRRHLDFNALDDRIHSIGRYRPHRSSRRIAHWFHG